MKNAEALILGDISLWFTSVLRAGWILQDIGYRGLINVGEPVAKNEAYLVGSPRFDGAVAGRIAAAVLALKEDGSYARLLAKYDVARSRRFR